MEEGSRGRESVTDMDPWVKAEKKLAQGKTGRELVWEEFVEVG